MPFVKFTISSVLVLLFILLWTFDRSFRHHQKTLRIIQLFNQREGLYCSRVHVGHDGTTLSYRALPKEVGTAGTVDFPSLSVDPCELISFTNSSLFMLLSLGWVLLLLLLLGLSYRKFKKRESPSKQQE